MRVRVRVQVQVQAARARAQVQGGSVAVAVAVAVVPQSHFAEGPYRALVAGASLCGVDESFGGEVGAAVLFPLPFVPFLSFILFPVLSLLFSRRMVMG